MAHINKMKAVNLQHAEQMLRAGRSVGFTKFITGISMSEMIRHGWLYEVKIPHPKGWTIDAATGEKRHDGSVLSTGNFRPSFPLQTIPVEKSNKQLKREDRKAFFDSRRLKTA